MGEWRREVRDVLERLDGKLSRAVCAARRFVTSLMQSGRTWRVVLGSTGLPDVERQRGQEHASNVVKTGRRVRFWAARLA
jgi:hypothetical protein